MIEFNKKNGKLILIYTVEGENYRWVEEKLKDDYPFVLRKIFNVSAENLYKTQIDEEGIFDEPYGKYFFEIGVLENEYFNIKKGIVTRDFNVFIYENVDITEDLFLAESGISIFRNIEEIIKQDIYIGGNKEGCIPSEDFEKLISNFPNSYEKSLYAKSRITAFIEDYFNEFVDGKKKFNNYLNKKKSIKGNSIESSLREYETYKFKFILDELKRMLKTKDAYSENAWQEKIIEIIKILYPKYIGVFKSADFKTTLDESKQLDFLLVDANGFVDIIEVKRAFENEILSTGMYRKNYIPKRSLSGTIMQLEKYIYHLVSNTVTNERILNKKFSSDLPDGLEIKIGNPKGFIITGRDYFFNSEQKKDFEIIKRKYSNVVDIITYDDLINRLKMIVKQLEKTNK